MKRLLFLFGLLSLSLNVYADKTCAKWDETTVDQRVGKCANQDYEKLIPNGGPRQLICTNMNYPLYWTCYNINKDNGTPTAKSLYLDEAVGEACNCN